MEYLRKVTWVASKIEHWTNCPGRGIEREGTTSRNVGKLQCIKLPTSVHVNLVNGMSHVPKTLHAIVFFSVYFYDLCQRWFKGTPEISAPCAPSQRRASVAQLALPWIIRPRREPTGSTEIDLEINIRGVKHRSTFSKQQITLSLYFVLQELCVPIQKTGFSLSNGRNFWTWCPTGLKLSKMDGIYVFY